MTAQLHVVNNLTDCLQAILEAEGVHTEEFSQEVLDCLPPTPWSIAPQEIAKRRDLRELRWDSADALALQSLDLETKIAMLVGIVEPLHTPLRI